MACSAPYTGIKTNLLFFTKGTPTQHIWFYEHPYPPGVKSYNKTKPMRIEEFDAEAAWWGQEADGFQQPRRKRTGLEGQPGRHQGAQLQPRLQEPAHRRAEIHDPDLLLAQYQAMQDDIAALRGTA